MKITRTIDRQFTRYVTRFGTICVTRNNRANVNFLPGWCEHISIAVSREKAAAGLRIWRKEAQ